MVHQFVSFVLRPILSRNEHQACQWSAASIIVRLSLVVTFFGLLFATVIGMLIILTSSCVCPPHTSSQFIYSILAFSVYFNFNFYSDFTCRLIATTKIILFEFVSVYLIVDLFINQPLETLPICKRRKITWKNNSLSTEQKEWRQEY